MVSSWLIKNQYFITKENSKISEIIDNYFKDRKRLYKNLQDFSKDIGLETEEIAIDKFDEFVFRPTKNDKLLYKNKFKRIDDSVYKLRKNSKEYKEFTERKNDGMLKRPYLELSKELGIPNQDKGHEDICDIMGKITLFKGQYLLKIICSEPIKHSDLIEIAGSTYQELLKIIEINAKEH